MIRFHLNLNFIFHSILYSNLFFLIFTLTPQSLYAETLSNNELQKQNLYFVIDLEGGQWFTSLIHAPNNQLQETQEIHFFSNQIDALDYAQKRTQSLLKTSDSSILMPTSIRSMVTTEMPEKYIWKSENEWSWDWEIKYSQWINENVDIHFFKNHNIATDCADVAIAARWIFSRIHKLPAAQTLAGSQILFSNESFKKTWETLPTHEDWTQDALFLKALNYLLVNTYTHTLWQDSYPIHISKDTFLFGTHHLSLRDTSGHTMLYRDHSDQNIQLIYSDVPRTVRTLYSSIMNEDKPSPEKQGFLKMRWPKKIDADWSLEPSNSMPHYSLNQYSDDFLNNEAESYSYGFLKELGLTPSIQDFYIEIIDNIYYAFQNRQPIVSNGYFFCLYEDCSPGTLNYENHSTPRRDARILERIQKGEAMLSQYGHLYPNLQNYWSFFLTWEIDIENHQINMKNLIWIWKNQLYSTDPRDSITKRWGINPDS